MKDTIALPAFAEEVLNGLQAKQKHLSSKYFYDEKGDELFQQIMHLEEYYLTRRELEIFTVQKKKILEAFYDGEPFRIIELGAGDGLKTKVLLSFFLEQGIDFTYSPVDISGNALDLLEVSLKSELPELKIDPFQGDYFDALSGISATNEKDVVFFLGSNIGNFNLQASEEFLSQLQSFLKKGDILLMGVDLKKDPSIILKAYNDAKGVTRAFNLNLLERINRELDGTFDLSRFLHYPYYNPQTGECRSYLISKTDQVVEVAGEKVAFNAWESIFMEISKKYDLQELQQLANGTGFSEVSNLLSADKWFADVLWMK